MHPPNLWALPQNILSYALHIKMEQPVNIFAKLNALVCFGLNSVIWFCFCQLLIGWPTFRFHTISYLNWPVRKSIPIVIIAFKWFSKQEKHPLPYRVYNSSFPRAAFYVGLYQCGNKMSKSIVLDEMDLQVAAILKSLNSSI